MNSQEAKNDLERLVLQSFITRLVDLGANELNIDKALEPLDFDDVRACYALSDDDLKNRFLGLF